MQAAKKRFKILSNKLININIGQWYLKDLSSKKITSNNYDPFNIKNYCVWFLAGHVEVDRWLGGRWCEREEEWRWWISTNLLPVFVGLYNHRKPRCVGEGSVEGERRRPLDGEDVGHTTARTVRDLGG